MRMSNPYHIKFVSDRKEITVRQGNNNNVVQRHYNSVIIFATNKYKPYV